MRYKNIFTGAMATVTKREMRKSEIHIETDTTIIKTGKFKDIEFVDYIKDAATPPQRTLKGAMTICGKKEFTKAGYVFDRCYKKVG